MMLWVLYRVIAPKRASPPYSQTFVSILDCTNIDKKLIPTIPPRPMARGPPQFRNYSEGEL